MIEVHGLASGWFRGEQERDCGGQLCKSQNYMVKPGTRSLEDGLRTADREEKEEQIPTRRGLKGPGH